jgi:antirestriction protein ArdC
MEAGNLPDWSKRWKGGITARNLTTMKPYRGSNWLITNFFTEFGSPYYMSFKQGRERGAFVKKGEKGTPIFYFRMFEKIEQGKKKSFPIFTYSTVFNLEQFDLENCDNNILANLLEPMEKLTFDPIEAAEIITAGYEGKPAIKHGGSSAHFNLKKDTVQMPAHADFNSAHDYYATLFHELTHSTGMPKRLDRKGFTDGDYSSFGSHAYSYEELIAELGAAFLCAESNIDKPMIENQAAYIENWLKALKAEPSILFDAAKDASKAVQFIMGENQKKKLAA